MSAKVVMEGLDEFTLALRKLPETLRIEADVIVQAQAEAAAQQIQRSYPQGPTGNLKRNITVNRESSQFASKYRLRSRAPHAHLFEYGTGPRKTNKGWNRGQMPRAPESEAAIPIIVRRRRALVAALTDMLKKSGFLVTTT